MELSFASTFRRKRINFNSDFSPLESLPQDILLHVLCGVDHDDLKQLFHVSKTIRDATLLVEKSHFKFTTPKKNTLPFYNCDLIDTNYKFSEIEMSNAPLKKPKESKFNSEELSEISMILFCIIDLIRDEDCEI
ncbi:F-box protein At1g61340-like [Cicer arietinum]|uniref:F-box protein At1g61340-like n=1 Tax=Cicer arietinum TaxID=3827 RepID=UPI00032ABFCD